MSPFPSSSKPLSPSPKPSLYENQSELNDVQSTLWLPFTVAEGDPPACVTDEMQVTCPDIPRDLCGKHGPLSFFETRKKYSYSSGPEAVIGLPPSCFVRETQQQDALPSFDVHSSMIASRPSETSMVSYMPSPLQQLPRAYVESRDIRNIKAAWDPVLHKEMDRHLDLIKEGVEGLSRSLSEIRGVMTKFERDETAELIVQGFLDRSPGLREVVTQFHPLVSQHLSQPAPEVVVACEGDDGLLCC